jgi:K+-transporting ATPase KdpF subunit
VSAADAFGLAVSAVLFAYLLYALARGEKL